MAEKILVADGNQSSVTALREILEQTGYEVSTAYSGKETLAAIETLHPSLVLLGLTMPDCAGIEVCRTVRANFMTTFIPVVMITETHSIDTELACFHAGADDYIVKPYLFDYKDVLARVESILVRTRKHIATNPLTYLPGATVAEEMLKERIMKGEPFAVGYADIDNFKSYNDYYGYTRGDDAIRFTSHLLVKNIRACGTPHDIVCHIGGDDFIFISTPAVVDMVSAGVMPQFDAGIKEYYNEEDVQRGYIISKNRQGQETRFPFMSISLGVVTNEHRILEHYAQVIQILLEVKAFAKKQTGSFYLKDRRKN